MTLCSFVRIYTAAMDVARYERMAKSTVTSLSFRTATEKRNKFIFVCFLLKSTNTFLFFATVNCFTSKLQFNTKREKEKKKFSKWPLEWRKGKFVFAFGGTFKNLCGAETFICFAYINKYLRKIHKLGRQSRTSREWWLKIHKKKNNNY